jgi:hypothetical protein
MKVTDPTATASESLSWSPPVKLYGPLETARMLSITPRKLRTITQSGLLESVRIGAAYRYRDDSIVNYIDRCTQPAVTK